MPQMSPLNWMILFMFFSSIFFLFNLLNFYMNLPIPYQNNIFKSNFMNKYNWKW
uniref:ATP synthase complex subunit 8 n=1 Tax=Pselaphinae sp. 11 EF-2015 TaxID=1756855 RepID=A0A0S2M8Y5_9COLE|nr:ATP synthase F0 subunit 8 [Pselaphinae sp. 11 EF-2015]